MSKEIVVSSPTPQIRLITLNRPGTRNGLNVELVTQLYEAFDDVERDALCRVVVLTGSGAGFCSGIDLGGYGKVPGFESRGRTQQIFAIQQHIAGLIPRMRRLPQPIIAAVNGAATGGGLALALGSDIRFCNDSARFNAAFIRIGLSACDIGVSWALPRVIGAARAHEMMLTGRMIDAEEAARIGLVVDVIAPDELLARAYAEAELIIRNTPMGVRMTKEVMWSALEIPGQQAAIDLENRTQVMLTQTKDHREALASFVERRAPLFDDQ